MKKRNFWIITSYFKFVVIFAPELVWKWNSLPADITLGSIISARFPGSEDDILLADKRYFQKGPGVPGPFFVLRQKIKVKRWKKTR